MPTITPCLWFDDDAEEAMTLYTSLFPDSSVRDVSRYDHPETGVSTVMTAVFEIAGREFQVLNGGPQFPFTEAISLTVSVETQEELDRYWDALIADGGEESQCGWLKDRFGLSWQIVPTALPRLLGDPDPARAGRAMQAMLGMRRLDIAALEAAADGTA